MAKKKNPSAVELGRIGGKKKVPKGLAMMDPEEAKRIRSLGGKARWSDRGKKTAKKAPK